MMIGVNPGGVVQVRHCTLQALKGKFNTIYVAVKSVLMVDVNVS